MSNFTGGSVRLRRQTSLLAAGLVAASGLVLAVAPSASAATGNCNTRSDGGWTVRSCLSVKGGKVRPEFYVDRVGKKFSGAKKCVIVASLAYSTRSNFATEKIVWGADHDKNPRTYPCKKGHVPYTHLTTKSTKGYYILDVLMGARRSSFDKKIWVGYLADSPSKRIK
ncbi:hypothetical protein NE236_34650 [Actinoallomurus purpureus]|uniref:hypothetical protein n=1 Tax=Actinoallomurus purpureus TaxID=478114 RepID=UPI002092E95C|nr:hypothetical protein [Actinoallomurus purpureus]MCO6010120.1 hypothetical protein [Actinoallomurus purpureus]